MADVRLDKPDIGTKKILRSAIPSYSLYGEAHGGPFPDCLHCETIAERSSLYAWHIRPHRHYGLHQFIWIEKGVVTTTSDGRRQVLSAPAAIMNAPSAVHGFEFEEGTEGYVVTVPTVHLERNLPQQSLLLDRLNRSILLQCGREDAGVEAASSLFAAVAQEYRDRQEGRAEALLCLAGLLALWFIREAGRRTADGRPAERPQIPPVHRFLALIESHFCEHRPLSFYARALDLTTRHLSRLCRQQLGLSARDAIHDRLLLEAKRILAYTPASIAEAAEELGFGDPAYFTRFFTRHAGETPTAFRNGVVLHSRDR